MQRYCRERKRLEFASDEKMLKNECFAVEFFDKILGMDFYKGFFSDEKIISENEYMKTSGLAAYEKEFGHGGARENAGRKQKFGSPLKFQIRVTQEEKDFITYARKHHINYTAMMK